MKKISLILFAVIAMVAGGNAFAQGKYGADSAECIKYLSYYQEYYKQKNYDDALRNWRKAYKLCPGSASQNMFIHGTTLMTRVYSQTRDRRVPSEPAGDRSPVGGQAVPGRRHDGG